MKHGIDIDFGIRFWTIKSQHFCLMANYFPDKLQLKEL